MRRILALTLLTGSALAFIGCAAAETDSTPADTGADFGDGPTTTRPDDGVDTATSDTATGDSGDTATSDTAPSDTATGDSASVDGGSPSAARIHEVFVNQTVTGGDNIEWIELAAPAGTPLSALWLRIFDKTGKLTFDQPVADAGTAMGSSGYWVVGGALATTVDKFYTSVSDGWGLASDGGSIQLTRNDGVAIELVDVVGYGTAPTTTTASAPTKLVEGTAVALPASGTFGRKSVPGDTDANAVDFCAMAATPRAVNSACAL